MAKVLIVDDLEENLYLLRITLENYGHVVQAAGNGSEALAAARAQPPDIVVADILMPVMDGFTLCRHWRQDPLLWKIPFIFYTATYTDAKDEQFALSLGADRFISKPAEPDIIVQAIQVLLANHAAIGRISPQGLPPETVFLKEYNAALIRKLEDKLNELEVANAELCSLDVMKNNLLANVSHELRTPLVAVRGYAEMISAGRSGPVTTQQREQCGVMLRNVDRLLVLIDNLLQLTRSVHDDSRPQGALFAADELLAEAAGLVRDQAEEKGVAMHCRGGGVPVFGDRRQLLQVLINLLDNAIKFTPAGGTVTVTATASADGVRLAVADTGRGIPPEEQKRIFERFYQVDGSSTREHGGLGLGLTIAREITARHSGQIEVASSPGQGATFTIVLPTQR